MQSHLGVGFQPVNFGGNEVQSIKVALTWMEGAMQVGGLTLQRGKPN